MQIFVEALQSVDKKSLSRLSRANKSALRFENEYLGV
jgi:hypothetical protein